jgi:hypothetical protein
VRRAGFFCARRVHSNRHAFASIAMNTLIAAARPYNVSHLDSAIQHLEQVLNLEGANSLFSKTYWHGRVVQALETPGLAPCQETRLNRLLDRIARS